MLSQEDINKFLNSLSDVLEISNSSLNYESKLEEINWDSLSVIGCISIVDDLFEVRLSGEDLSNSSSVKDIIDLINAKL